MTREMTDKEIKISDTFRRHLTFSPLYTPNQHVWVTELEGRINLIYNSNNALRKNTTNVHLDLHQNRCDLHWIERAKEHQGHGYGAKLYQMVELFVNEMGAKTVRVIPTGRKTIQFWEQQGFRKLNAATYQKEI